MVGARFGNDRLGYLGTSEYLEAVKLIREISKTAFTGAIRKTKLITKKGESCLKIASVNLGDFRTATRYVELLARLKNAKMIYFTHKRNTYRHNVRL